MSYCFNELVVLVGEAATYGSSLTLSGSATEGSFIYISSEAAQFSTFLGIPAQFISNALNVNGDDVVGIFKDDALVDQFGR